MEISPRFPKSSCFFSILGYGLITRISGDESSMGLDPLDPKKRLSFDIPGLVNIQKTMENHHF